MGFDSVTVQSENGQARALTRDEFYRIPLEQRVRMLCKGMVKFFREGRSIPATEAMKQA
jgi:hypothetical protein